MSTKTQVQTPRTHVHLFKEQRKIVALALLKWRKLLPTVKQEMEGSRFTFNVDPWHQYKATVVDYKVVSIKHYPEGKLRVIHL